MKIILKHREKEIWLVNDPRNFIIHEGYKITKFKDGKVKRKMIRAMYYSNFELFLNGILKKAMHMSKAKTLEDLLEEVGEIKRLIFEKVRIT